MGNMAMIKVFPLDWKKGLKSMRKTYIVYYPIGGKQIALSILQLLSTGVQPDSIDLPRGYQIEEISDVDEVERINPIEELYDLGGEG